MKTKTTKKFVTAVCMSAMLLTGVTGCSKETESSQTAQEEPKGKSDKEAIQEKAGSESDSAAAQEKSSGKADDQPVQAEQDNDSDSGTAGENADSEADKEGDEAVSQEKTEGSKLSKEEGTEYLPGKVQSVETDNMVVAQTTVMGEDSSSVILVDEKDARKITVKFTTDTKVEHWVIQGGGAGIDMRDAAISDLEPGMGVEIEGYYEGETFVAVKVLIEEYQ